MEQITEVEIDLFAENLPSMDEIKALSEHAHFGEYNLLKFGEQVESHLEENGQKARLAAGIGLFILGRDEEAIKKLKKAQDCKEKYIYLAFALRRTGEFEKAIENLQKSRDYDADKMNIKMEKTATYRHAGNFGAASKQLKSCKNFENVSAEYHYQVGRLEEAQGLYGEAIENYTKAVELSPEHQRALFHVGPGAFCCHTCLALLTGETLRADRPRPGIRQAGQISHAHFQTVESRFMPGATGRHSLAYLLSHFNENL